MSSALSWIVTAQRCRDVMLYRGVASAQQHTLVELSPAGERFRVYTNWSPRIGADAAPVQGVALYAARDPRLIVVEDLNGGLTGPPLVRLTLDLPRAEALDGDGAYGLVEFVITDGLPAALERPFFEHVAANELAEHIAAAERLMLMASADASGEHEGRAPPGL